MLLYKRISHCYVLGHAHDINDHQEGQVPSVEMPYSSAEFHYTVQKQSHCASAAHPTLTFQDALPKGYTNIQ